MSDLILYTTEDGQTRLNLRADGLTVWLSQLEIAELFQTTKQNVSLHAKNIFKDGELRSDSVVKESLTTAADGKRYRTQLYNLDLILAIGYRVRSPRGAQFRQWATVHLREFIVKGQSRKDLAISEIHPGGVAAISRGLSEAIPPEEECFVFPDPGRGRSNRGHTVAATLPGSLLGRHLSFPGVSLHSTPG